MRRIRLHGNRNTALSLMEKAGVPTSIIAAWAGHYPAAFTMATYVHANPDDLAADGIRTSVSTAPYAPAA